MNQLSVGAVLPISVKLSDENTSRIIKADVLDSAGNVLHSEINLTHRLNGFYLNSGYFMPDLNSVQIVYRVYDQSNVFLISATETLFKMPDVVPVLMLTAEVGIVGLSASIAEAELNAQIIEGEQ